MQEPFAEADVTLNAEDGVVTLRLPRRNISPSDQALVKKRMRIGRYWDVIAALLFPLAMVGIIFPVMMAFPFTHYLIGAVIGVVSGCLFFATHVSRRSWSAIENQASRCELVLSTGVLLIREVPPYPDRWIYRLVYPTSKRIDPLRISRLRVDQIDVTQEDSQGYRNAATDAREPQLWVGLNGLGASLIADGADGRVFTVLAHAYPVEVLMEAAHQLKPHLDAYRKSYDQQLAQNRPSVRLPDIGDGVPVTRGARFRVPTGQFKLSPSSPISSSSRGDCFVINVPRGEQMESVQLEVSSERLVIERSLLLGELRHTIEKADFRDLSVDTQQLADSDIHRLLLRYYKSSTHRIEELELMKGCSWEEVCWVAAEIRARCSPRARSDDPLKQPVWQYNLAHLLYVTTLSAVFLACSALIKPWGWIFGIQFVALILCLTSMTGIRSLAPYTNRSWTRTEMVLGVIVGIVLLVVWLFRFLATQ